MSIGKSCDEPTIMTGSMGWYERHALYVRVVIAPKTCDSLHRMTRFYSENVLSGQCLYLIAAIWVI
jgi:hypothetical protein